MDRERRSSPRFDGRDFILAGRKLDIPGPSAFQARKYLLGMWRGFGGLPAFRLPGPQSDVNCAYNRAQREVGIVPSEVHRQHNRGGLMHFEDSSFA